MPKSLKLTEPFIHILREKKADHCMACTNIAVQEACLYAGSGVTMIEKYYDKGAKKVTKPKGR